MTGIVDISIVNTAGGYAIFKVVGRVRTEFIASISAMDYRLVRGYALGWYSHKPPCIYEIRSVLTKVMAYIRAEETKWVPVRSRFGIIDPDTRTKMLKKWYHYQSLGGSRKEFCKLYGIGVKTLGRWIRDTETRNATRLEGLTV